MAKGFTQKPGTGFSETFVPVVKYASIHPDTSKLQGNYMLNILVLKQHFTIEICLKRAIWNNLMVFRKNEKGILYASFKKSTYGLKQAARAWNEKDDFTITETRLPARESRFLLIHQNERWPVSTRLQR